MVIRLSKFQDIGFSGGSSLLDSAIPLRYNLAGLGPVAQLGARFNRTEEVEGSNPSRSTLIPPQVGVYVK